MTSPTSDQPDEAAETLGAKAKAAADQAKAAATREMAELKDSLERTLDGAGVDTAALAQTAREHATTVERLLKEELEHRPFRTLAVAAAIGALFGAIISR